MKITIYTDGASRGNPGHSSYGYSIKNEKGELIHEEGKYIGIATNNFAEYSAVVEALKYVEQKFNKKSLQVKFLMDSKLVVEQLSGRFKIKSKNLIPLIIVIKELEGKLESVTYEHIPRALNSLADSLANKALDSRLT